MGANSRLVSQSLTHQAGLQKVTAKTVRELIKLLNENEADIMAQIQARLSAIAERGFDNSPATVRRLDAMLIENRRLSREAYARLGYFLRKEMRDLGEYESDFQARMMAESIGVRNYAKRQNAKVRIGSDGKLNLSLVRPPATQLIASIERSPFQGAIMSRWVERLSEDEVKRVQGAINIGLAQGQSVEQIMRRLRGTQAQNYQDGAVAVSRRHAETWVNTALAHVTNEAQDAFYAANSGLLEGVLWNCIFEPGLCAQCIPRHGKLYSAPEHRPIGHSLPWLSGPGRLHPNDKCNSIPQWKKSKRLASEIGISADESKRLFGEPAQARLTAENWLKENPDAAEIAYGKKRAALFAKGGVSATDLIKSTGELWTLADLQEREVEAFKRLAKAEESG